MAHSNGYVVAIKAGQNVISERMDGVVPIPYGVDYVIRLTNRNSRRAVARVKIDGNDIGSFVIDPYQTFDLERPEDKAVTFRLVSSHSAAAAAHGKAGADVDGSKGLIQVEWRGELTPPAPRRSSLHNSPTRWDVVKTYDSIPCLLSFADSTPRRLSVADNLGTAVTVEGQYSNQRFTSVEMGTLETHATILTLKLMGYEATEAVAVVGVNYCPKCRTKTVKPTDKFCRICGTSFSA